MPWTFEPFSNEYGVNDLRIIALMPQPNNEGPSPGLGNPPDMGRWFTTYAIENTPHGSQRMFFFNTIAAIRSAADLEPNGNPKNPAQWDWTAGSEDKLRLLEPLLKCGRVVDIDDEGGGGQANPHEIVEIANANIGRVLERILNPIPPTHVLVMGNNAQAAWAGIIVPAIRKNKQSSEIMFRSTLHPTCQQGYWAANGLGNGPGWERV